jgi:hypothetical protein
MGGKKTFLALLQTKFAKREMGSKNNDNDDVTERFTDLG